MPKRILRMIAGLAAWGVSTAQLPAAVPAAGEALEVPIQKSGPVQSLTFRYCPPGTLRPGKPKAEQKDAAPAGGGIAAALARGNAEQMRPFFISEAEITIPQFKEVSDPETFAGLVSRVERMKKGNPELHAAVNSLEDLPVFAITVEEAAAFCKQLSDRLNAKRGEETLEERRCRLPSHYEWQYACRAQVEPMAAPPLPHFNRWPESFDVLDKAIRQVCLDEWHEMGKAEADFRGTQEQVAAILTRQSEKNRKPLEILSAFLKAGLGLQRDFAVERPGKLVPGRKTAANAWNIYDMHENLREWVIAANDQVELDQFWRRLVAKDIDADANGKKHLFLAGGGFANLMTGKEPGAWQQFTIWGGHPLELASGTPLFFSLQQAKADDVAFDQLPGLRVVLERVLREDWLWAVRRWAIRTDLAQLRQQPAFDRYRAQVAELVPDKLQSEHFAKIAFYESLAAYRDGQKDAARRKLAEVKANLVSEKKPPKKGAALDDLLGGAPSDAKPKQEKPSEEAVFLNQLENLLAADAAAAPPLR